MNGLTDQSGSIASIVSIMIGITLYLWKKNVVSELGQTTKRWKPI